MVTSATSRCSLVPFERYGSPKKCAKKVLVTIFPYLFYIKNRWNIVHVYLKTKIFSRDTNILPQMHWTSNIFGPSATSTEGFWVSLNYLILCSYWKSKTAGKPFTEKILSGKMGKAINILTLWITHNEGIRRQVVQSWH